MANPQTLVLAVLGSQAAQFGARAQKSFEARDGSIGRADDCDWVLSAAGISRVHAMVRCLNGMYFIEDRSTNGMLLNGRPLVKGDPASLKDGDRLQIDTFEVGVRLQADNATVVQPAASPPLAAVAPMSAAAPLPGGDFLGDMLGDDPFGEPLPVRGGPDEPLIPGAGAAAGALDPLAFLDEPFAAAPAHAPAPAESWNHSSGMADHFHPPAVAGQREALPENWDLTMGDFAPKAPPPPPPAPVMPPAAAPVTPVAPVAVAPAAPAAGLPPELDTIFRIVVDGVMDVLRARAEIKNTFRLPVTLIQRSENNPLKFAPTADEALQKLLAPANGAFLSGTDAFQDAFDDIRCHQMAMLAGVRAGFEAVLAHFNPDRYEQEVDGGKRSAFGGKGRYWERYRENFEGLAKDPDECFRRLFGDEFARAYEEQLARLKSARARQR
ncbi:type VI secretion system-associated FHA domain protein TagH [Frateuria sp. STR12]|uniref:type VI secretion system-associated FHA domain protein TagH n=1 Tax=Frateuria hangzhouensis TaxID=2995589 RepID=UPI002260BB9A|nr:type VI secretion system-associated FHA domain protein TagH [Frateuria sp. STR12]MCX7514338.1 type VI secretion system-associated FHA domain protein TagH [Frateuria sp. STR12]